MQSLLKSKTPAWQRLQAVRAIEAYRDLVLQTAVPSLMPIRQKLSQMADQERATGLGSGGPGVQDERHLIGRIDPAEPAIVQQMRRELRPSGNRAPGAALRRLAAAHVSAHVIEAVRRLHERDLEEGFGQVYLPHALERKYPNENREFGWQWIFPSRKLAKDPRSGKFRRHHVSDEFFGDFFKQAVDRVGITKNAVPHSLRTVSRPICWKTVRTSGPCRSCSDTRTCGRR